MPATRELPLNVEIICSHQAPGVLFDLVLVVELSTEMVTTHMPSEESPEQNAIGSVV